MLSDDRIVFGSGGALFLLDIKNGNLLMNFNNGSLVDCISVLPDDKVITGSPDGTVKVWCLITNKCIKTINASPSDQRYFRIV